MQPLHQFREWKPDFLNRPQSHPVMKHPTQDLRHEISIFEQLFNT